MRDVKDDWRRKKFGVQLGSTDHTRLTNLRFADDLLLIARTKPQLQKMLGHIHERSLQCGLELHPGKTKILTNATRKQGRGKERYLDINDMQIEILTLEQSARYLGIDFCFADRQQREMQNRIRAAWAKFQKHKQELTSKNYDLRDRLRLFDATVSPTFLYGSSTWTVTKEVENAITRTQRRMLRM
eukprot:12028777-Karenia_brevis.AAC.1